MGILGVPKTVGKAIVRFIQAIIDELEQLADEVSADPVVLQALAADLGVAPERLNIPEKDRPKTGGIDDYLNSVDSKAEQLVIAAEFISSYIAFWKDIISAALEGDSSAVADELVYRLFQLTTVNVIKFRYPDAYYWMRLLGVIYLDLRLSVEEAFAPEVPANLFTSEYWNNLGSSFEKGYLKFRLDQAADLFLKPPGPNDPPLTPGQIIERRQLGYDIFGRSDLLLMGAGFMFVEWVLKSRLKKLNLEVNHFYGWELPPGPDIPLSERIASRGYTLKLTSQAGAPASSSAILTQFLLADENGRIGWMLSLRGAIVFEEKAGSEERPIKIKITVDTPDGLDAVIFFSGEDKFKAIGAPTAGMKLSIEPAQPATVGPAISLPETKGTRLEIGDFSFKVDISSAGFKIKASTLKSALVIDKGEADEFIQETLPQDEVRIDFALGLAADQDNGIYFEGGNRLAATIPVNKSFLGITVQSISLALNPVTAEMGSELQFTAATSLAFDLGPLHISIDQIGLTLDFGSNGESRPADVLELLPFLYMRKPGFRPPNGVGILVDSMSVTGGGFLFFDRENEQYAGVLQLEIGSRLSLKAIGLLTTRLPDGSKGFSLLVIISVEFDPPFQIGLGFTLGGIGGYIGIHRTVDTNVLREGLHNRTLDAILFPKDPVINAGRILNTLRSVFPPARGRHLFGLALIIGWGTPSLINMELAVIYEKGDNPRLIILGQIHMLIPSKKPIIEFHLDAIGIWDYDRSEFSLDAHLYDSRIAFIQLSGDMALRVRRGTNPFYMLSIGGYHPAFNVPPDFPKLDRITVKFVDSPNLRLILTGYFAVTSNTRQAGGKIDFFAKIGSVSFEALIQIDVLWEPDVRFLADFDIKIAIKYKGHTLFGAHAVGQFSGPEPKRVKGKVSISLFFFDINVPFDKTFGDDRPPAELPQVNPLNELVAALKDTRSWDAPLPSGSRMLVSLRKQPGNAEVLVHPLGGLSVRQQVLPLGIHLDRFEGGVPSGDSSFSITSALIAGDPVEKVNPLNEFFAPAEFIQMSDDEKIARPSFEAMPAGISLQPVELAFGGDTPATVNQAAISEMDFDEKIVGASGNASNGQVPGLLTGTLAVAAASFGAAARSALRITGPGHFSAPGSNFRVSHSGYVIASVDDLTTAPLGQDGLIVSGQSFTAVQQALEIHLKANPKSRGQLQVVAAFQAEEIQ